MGEQGSFDEACPALLSFLNKVYFAIRYRGADHILDCRNSHDFQCFLCTHLLSYVFYIMSLVNDTASI